MSPATPIVLVVDDDISVHESLEALVRFAGWQPETFASAQEFLSRPPALVPNCLVVDVSLPGLNGLDLQKLIAPDRIDMSIIFITGHGDDGPGHDGGSGGVLDEAIHRRRAVERYSTRHRAQPHRALSRDGNADAPRLLRIT